MDFYQHRLFFGEDEQSIDDIGLARVLWPEPTYQRVAPEISAQHTMRAQAILSLGDTPKHQAMALQHLEAAFIAAHPGWRPLPPPKPRLVSGYNGFDLEGSVVMSAEGQPAMWFIPSE